MPEIVETNTDYNIDDNDFKQVVSRVAELIRYKGPTYLSRIKAINDEYIIKGKRTLEIREFAELL